MRDKHQIDYDFDFTTLGNDTTVNETQTSAEISQSVEALKCVEKSVETPKEKHDSGHDETDKLSKLHSLGFYTASDFYDDAEPVEYLIDNIIQREAYHQVFGASGNGKSFVVLDMACSIAYKKIEEWVHKPVEHGDVIYFVGEGSKGMQKRFRLWCQMHKADPKDINIVFHKLPFKLDDKGQAENVINTIKEISDNPVLVIFDTLNIYMAGEENSNTDAGKFNFACNQIIQKLHTAVLTVHHAGKGEETKKQSRGASAFHAALDIEFKVDNNGDGLITLAQTKNKDNEVEKPLLFNLKQYEINGKTDKHGKPVTSCVIYPAEELMQAIEVQAAERKVESNTKPKPKRDKFAFDTYYQTAEKYGEIVIDNEETGHAVVRVDEEDWRTVSYANSTSDNDSTKRGDFNYYKKLFTQLKDYTQPGIATLKNIEGHRYYVMDLSNEDIPVKYRAGIRKAIESRKQSETVGASTEERTAELFENQNEKL